MFTREEFVIFVISRDASVTDLNYTPKVILIFVIGQSKDWASWSFPCLVLSTHTTIIKSEHSRVRTRLTDKMQVSCWPPRRCRDVKVSQGHGNVCISLCVVQCRYPPCKVSKLSLEWFPPLPHTEKAFSSCRCWLRAELALIINPWNKSNQEKHFMHDLLPTWNNHEKCEVSRIITWRQNTSSSFTFLVRCDLQIKWRSENVVWIERINCNGHWPNSLWKWLRNLQI